MLFDTVNQSEDVVLQDLTPFLHVVLQDLTPFLHALAGLDSPGLVFTTRSAASHSPAFVEGSARRADGASRLVGEGSDAAF